MNYKNHTMNDRWIVEHVFQYKKNGFFVEAGACAGKGGSCTYVLEKHLGWVGILAEPADDWFLDLVQNRPNSRCFNVCLHDQNTEVDFVRFTESGFEGYSGIPQNWLGHSTRIRKEWNSYEHKKSKKKAVTLEQLLIDGNAPSVIDYLALDIEKSEHKVLSVFPFDSYQFKAISIEGPTPPVLQIFKKNGYFRIDNPFTDTLTDGYFVHKDYFKIGYKV